MNILNNDIAIKRKNIWNYDLYATRFYASETRFVVRITNDRPENSVYVNATFVLFTRYTIELFKIISNGLTFFSSCDHEILITHEFPVTEIVFADDRSYMDIKMLTKWCYYNFIGSTIGAIKFTQVPWYD